MPPCEEENPNQFRGLSGERKRGDFSPLGGFGNNHGEFDPGSERTLAARLKHASRTGSTRLRVVRVADW